MGRFDLGFDGTVALVTGGASGIGRATSRHLAAAGARVVVADVDASGAAAVAEEIDGHAVHLDVSDPGAWSSVLSEVQARQGALHLAFLNAGVTTFSGQASDLAGPFEIEALSDAQYRRIMGANVDGVILGTRACAPVIAASGGGAILATSSAAGVIAFPPDPIYTATKHAVVGFIRSMAPWLSAQGIGCHAILPGAVDTHILQRNVAEEARAHGVELMAPERIADAVLKAAQDPETGGLWLCLPGQAPFRYTFSPIHGLGVPDLEESSRG
ncbi:MAG: SDR family NAD(P)-dependent oxidoreductase [Myxococcota bacterium]|nr:SDR family NAD(P)-dependent oxidoreductase [Myxococcota bacterium]